MTDLSLIYLVCAHKDEAQAIARNLLEKRLVACANILQGHDSLYWWDGKIQTGQEVSVILKTRAELFEAVKNTVLELHSYECPCTVSWGLEHGHEPFLQWIKTETKI